jgi:2-amino-4-hydroxy-6-hydroxymethyldihydropteridine diphosphokinase
MKPVLIALGSNLSGPLGSPIQTLRAATRLLAEYGVGIIRASSLYETEPLGGNWQPPYLNAVVLAKGAASPAALLRQLKRIEKLSGRRTRTRWAPRPLDLDIIDHAGRSIGWPPRRRSAGRLILPHPEAHRRAFVLVPLLDVLPKWHHPALGIQGRVLLERLGAQRRGVRRVLDSQWLSCDKDFS